MNKAVDWVLESVGLMSWVEGFMEKGASVAVPFARTPFELCKILKAGAGLVWKEAGSSWFGLLQLLYEAVTALALLIGACQACAYVGLPVVGLIKHTVVVSIEWLQKYNKSWSWKTTKLKRRGKKE